MLTHRVLWRESVPGGHPYGLVLFHHGVVANVVRRERAVVGVNLEKHSIFTSSTGISSSKIKIVKLILIEQCDCVAGLDLFDDIQGRAKEMALS